MPRVDAESERIFGTLVARNALNLHAPAHASGVVAGDAGTEAMRVRVRALLAAIELSTGGGTAGTPDPESAGATASTAGATDAAGPTSATTTSGSARRALLLVGSAKQPRSTSEALGEHLLARLRERGFETETLFLHRCVHTEAGRTALLAAADATSVVVLASPLYIDSLPCQVVRAMELLAWHRAAAAERPRQHFLCIVNCGFPEAHHNDTAVAICRRFARETGLDWAGGLELGGGEAIDGRPLRARSGMLRNVIRALDLAAEALAAERPVPPEAAAIMSKPLVPAWAYTLLGDRGWKQRARKYGAERQLRARPYSTAS